MFVFQVSEWASKENQIPRQGRPLEPRGVGNDHEMEANSKLMFAFYLYNKAS